jgi:hypothetical protein
MTATMTFGREPLQFAGFEELSNDELLMVDGGEWSWKEFGQSTVAGAVGCSLAGAAGGTMHCRL